MSAVCQVKVTELVLDVDTQKERKSFNNVSLIIDVKRDSNDCTKQPFSNAG